MMDILHLYGEEDGMIVCPRWDEMIVCPRCDGNQYIDDVEVGSSPNHPPYHTYTCVNCHEKVNIEVCKFVRVSRPRVILQPLCSICKLVLVENHGDACPGCEDRVRIETRDRPGDQAALGKWF